MFEFDPTKSMANLAKHGIDFETAQALWLDDRKVFGPSVSPNEERWMLVASLNEKMWSAVYTWRDNSIRLISVRRSRPDEVWEYDHQAD